MTNLTRPNRRVIKFYDGHGTAEPWIREGKNALRWTRLPCHAFRHNAVRLQLHVLAYNLANFMLNLALPEEVEHWSLTTLREKLAKIGARIVHGHYVYFSWLRSRCRGHCLRASCGGSMTCSHGRRRSRHEDRER